MAAASSREGTLRKSNVFGMFEDADEEESKVGFGSCSVFDVFVRSADILPFNVPVLPYLKEMLIGMQGSPDPGKDEPCANPQMRANWRHLKPVIKSEAMQHVLDCLFWITTGVIFRRLVEDAKEEFQHRLASAWYLVILEVNNKVHNDIEARDWLLGTLPVVLVQAVYRLMVDAFPDDRSQLVHHADPLLEKLTVVVFYEVAGFQLNDETCRRARRQLFKQNVLENPFVNQHESLKSQMRREALENQSKKLLPLTFGQVTGLALEETQLEHVMMGREEERKKSQSSLSPAVDKPELLSLVPKELSVDRYASVSQQGAVLFQKHLEELFPPGEDKEIDSPVPLPTRGNSRQGTRERQVSVLISDKAPRRSSQRQSKVNLSPKSRQKGGNRKTQVMFGPEAQNLAREKREAEDRERRRREDLLKQRIVDDPLPPELCETSLETTWVSPITDRLAPGERDRQALRKRAAEAHLLRMAPPQPDMLPDLGKSASAPSLSSKSHTWTVRKSKLRGDSEELPQIGQDGGEAAHAASHVFSPSEKAALDKGAIGPIAMRGSARLSQVKNLWTEKEPPITVKNDVVLYRLQDQLTCFHANSFGVYMKEFDITSGYKKQRMDPVAMRGAESDYVDEIQGLVGPRSSSALKMYDSPLQKVKKSDKTPAAGTANASTGGPKG
mmetsp:Transcript_114954/g.199277  ORF Transcript_114954/g.199277 Transcript_114954/m.199277 type:complete len:670 (-) Transcript_114954:48-2057(-)